MDTSTSFDLPFDCITEVLEKLPVETLMKFRAVCTSWRTYIDSPYFISKHRDLYNKHHSKNSYLLITTIGSRRFYQQRFTIDQDSITVTVAPFSTEFSVPFSYSVCKGLFLLILNGIGDSQKDIYLWNPYLRKSLILPPCPFDTPFKYSTYYVLGFSTSCDDYKVLAYRRRHIFNGNEYEPAMAVYSLKDHLWNIKINPMNVHAWTSLRDPFSCDLYVYCGGIVYWFTKANPEIIHAFDFDTEEFKNVPVPKPLEDSKNLVLFTIGECLAVLSLPSILVLEEHDGEYNWREWCSDSWIQNFFDVLEEYYSFTPKVFFQEESNTFLIIGLWGRILFYEVASQKLELLRNEDSNFFLRGCLCGDLNVAYWKGRDGFHSLKYELIRKNSWRTMQVYIYTTTLI